MSRSTFFQCNSSSGTGTCDRVHSLPSKKDKTARPQCDACVKRSESCQYIETQQQSNQRRIHELEQEQSSKEQRIRELEKEQSSKEQQIRELEKEQSSKEQRIHELEKEQNSKEQRIRELEEKILYEIPLECIKIAEHQADLVQPILPSTTGLVFERSLPQLRGSVRRQRSR
ncbi:hypothetical protein CRV24_006357 [Beauveria bassiana]|nr:hypothetical protein CRV24_006357 [Beauveria bassiana]KAH8715483.1 hypothetical protein HC256_004302 [Beauveria bassiana]